MSECAHRTGQFEGKDPKECDDAARQMIGIIKRRANIGLAYSVLRSDFDAVFNAAAIDSYGGVYTLCTQMILHGIAQWANERDYRGEIAYFFEAGHPSQSEANYYLNMIASERYHSSHRRHYRYGAHSFGLKKKILPLQAGDMLAWHWRLQRDRELKGKRSRRLDFTSLPGLPTLAVHAERQHLMTLLQETVDFQSGVLKGIGYSPEAIDDLIKARLNHM